MFCIREKIKNQMLKKVIFSAFFIVLFFFMTFVVISNSTVETKESFVVNSGEYILTYGAPVTCNNCVGNECIVLMCAPVTCNNCVGLACAPLNCVAGVNKAGGVNSVTVTPSQIATGVAAQSAASQVAASDSAAAALPGALISASTQAGAIVLGNATPYLSSATWIADLPVGTNPALVTWLQSVPANTTPIPMGLGFTRPNPAVVSWMASVPSNTLIDTQDIGFLLWLDKAPPGVQSAISPWFSTSGAIQALSGGSDIISSLPATCTIGLIGGTVDACLQTAFSLGLGFATNFEGGEQFKDYISDWTSSDFIPAMKDMTEQLNVAAVDQSRAIGSFFDAETQTKTQSVISDQEILASRRLQPSENMCAMASITTGMQTALQTTRAVKDAINQESAARALNLPGSGTEFGANSYQNKRWNEYCTYFVDTNDNNGVSGCPAMGVLPSADINVERFLFQDTIDLRNPNERMAADAVLRNLVDAGSLEPLVPNFNSTDAKRNKLKRDHFASLRQPLIDVVSGIIARRTSIPEADLGAGVGLAVQAVRTQAGIPMGETTRSPSYNEMMLARTKEYFFNVDKLLQVGNDAGAIRQELVINEALIAVTLQDIEELERQLNSVFMTASSMKYNAAEASSTSKNMSSSTKR